MNLAGDLRSIEGLDYPWNNILMLLVFGLDDLDMRWWWFMINDDFYDFDDDYDDDDNDEGWDG